MHTFTIRQCGLAALLCTASAASQATVVFADLPTNTSTRISFHNIIGPVLADDFIPIASGLVQSVDWWGSATTNPSWELALHSNAATNQPNVDSASAGSSFKYMMNAVGVHDASSPEGLFHYSATLSGPLMAITAGHAYWFTAANAAAGWSWADALNGPTIGDENFNAHSSIGGASLCGDSGPHCGPWVDVHTDLAFSVSAVPEPSTYVLMLLGLAGVSALARRRQRAADAQRETMQS